MQTPRATLSDDIVDPPPSAIDHALNALLGGPKIGKECPPCWRCCWFLGYLPAPAHFHPTTLADAEVQRAVRATERRKIEIANTVRSRHVEFTFEEDDDVVTDHS